MNIVILEYSDWLSVQIYIAQKRNDNLILGLVYGFDKPLVQSVSTWASLGQHQQETIFVMGDEEIIAFDISELELNSEAINTIIKTNNSNSDIYLVRRSNPKFTADEKKNIKATNLRFEKLNEQEFLGLVKDEIKTIYNYRSPQDLMLVNRATTINDCTKIAYLFELFQTSIDPALAKDEYQKVELFTLPLREEYLSQDITKWVNLVKDDEIQLSLALMFTKSEQWRNLQFKKNIQSSIIKSDLLIKTVNSLSSTQWWQYMVWKWVNLELK